MSALHIIRTHHGDYEARDIGGEVALIGFDAITQEWWIVANTDRYPTNASLPPCFSGRYTHSVAKFGDVFRLFGLPLPGAAAILIAEAA